MSDNLQDTDPIYSDSARLGFTVNDDGTDGISLTNAGNETPSEELLNAPRKSQNVPEELRDGIEALQAEANEPTVKKQKNNAFQKRLNQQVYKTKLAEEERLQLAIRLQETQRMLAQKEQELQKKEQLVNSYYDTTANTQELLIKNALREAKLNGDMDQEIELTDKLASLKAEKATNDLYNYQKENFSNKDQNYYDPNDVIETPIDNSNYVYEEPSYDDNPVHDWFASNPWLQKNQKLSDEFNELINNYSSQIDLAGIEVDPIEVLNQAKSDLMEYYGMSNQPQKQTNRPQETYSVPINYGRSNAAPVSRSEHSSTYQAASHATGGEIYNLNTDQQRALDQLIHMNPHEDKAKIINDFVDSIKKFTRGPNSQKLGFTVGG